MHTLCKTTLSNGFSTHSRACGTPKTNTKMKLTTNFATSQHTLLFNLTVCHAFRPNFFVCERGTLARHHDAHTGSFKCICTIMPLSKHTGTGMQRYHARHAVLHLVAPSIVCFAHTWQRCMCSRQPHETSRDKTNTLTLGCARQRSGLTPRLAFYRVLSSYSSQSACRVALCTVTLCRLRHCDCSLCK